jgi:hypothetical protein
MPRSTTDRAKRPSGAEPGGRPMAAPRRALNSTAYSKQDDGLGPADLGGRVEQHVLLGREVMEERPQLTPAAATMSSTRAASSTTRAYSVMAASWLGSMTRS